LLEFAEMAELETTGKTEDAPQVKSVKKPFDAECNKCKKHFKTKSAFEKHVGQQLCFAKDELSYCKTCNITLGDHAAYIRHLMTREHLGNIGVEKLDKLKEERPGAIHTADPYLSSNEAELLGTRNLGEKYTLVFENNEMQEVKLVRKAEAIVAAAAPILEPTREAPIMDRNIQSQAKTHEKAQAQAKAQEKERAAPDRINQPTPKQTEIIRFLERQKNPVEANNNFIKIITSKLELEDYYGLGTLIRENGNISLEVRQIILALISKFVDGLTKKRAGGQTTYNNKDIAKVVVDLSM